MQAGALAGLGQTLGASGSAALASAVGGAASNFTTSVIRGENVGDALKNSVVGGLTAYASSAGSSLVRDAITSAEVNLSPIQLRAVDSAVNSFIRTGLTGGDLEDAAINALLGGGRTLALGGLHSFLSDHTDLKGDALNKITSLAGGAITQLAASTLQRNTQQPRITERQAAGSGPAILYNRTNR